MTTQTREREDGATPQAAAAGRGGRRGTGARGTGEKPAPSVATPWGPAALAGQAQVTQRAGERRFTSVVQLLADERGEPLVRFAYTTGGVARRGPVTLRARDLQKLRVAVASQPALAALLGWEDGGAAA